ncbi:AAA family ATPase [Clostridium algidicarnis]|uniref:AAA family ATPase n=1 Tax=Clostridium algidicarnis TaxID=37659 RepID=UPI001C0D7E1D|nr:AAA family ATPase [Clostridium algidicarnis]MBU3206976.1 AAA family ATPase [Clostridium algidicarnis]
MQRPENMETYADIDLKLGIKSSLPNVKATLALLILIWKSEGCPAEIQYSVQNGNAIRISDDIMNRLITYSAPVYSIHGISDNDFRLCVSKNQLLKSQMEALIVAFELIWKVAKVRFQDHTKPFSAERTGGSRFPKIVQYTLNMDILNVVINVAEDNYKSVLLNWLGLNVPTIQQEDKLLRTILAAFSETAVYKLNDNGKDIIFNQDSIYRKLIASAEPVDIYGDGEAKGSLRILKSLLSDNLNPYLNYSGGKVTSATAPGLNIDAYQKRISALLSLSTTMIVGIDENETRESNETYENNNTDLSRDELIRFKTGYHTDYERNRIVFGAPGTGKSYELKNDYADLLKDTSGTYERVTFHPDYAYSHFVGTYKPVTDAEGEIKYEFVPGPFMRVYVAALKSGRTQKPQPHLLLIEEINRSKVAAVFGDVFQLLDRDDDGVSEYEIHASEDIRKHLAKKLGGSPEDFNRIRIPDNMFIWSTMNSADQGVFPMDTAFKRRWNFEYLGINQKDDSIHGKITLGTGTHTLEVDWNQLRKAINEKLVKDYKVNEDKLMGPFFLSKKIFKTNGTDDKIANPDKFIAAFKSKIIMYLYEDVAKQHKNKLFGGCDSGKYSSVCDAFDKIGIDIFGDDFRELYEQQGV